VHGIKSAIDNWKWGFSPAAGLKPHFQVDQVIPCTLLNGSDTDRGNYFLRVPLRVYFFDFNSLFMNLKYRIEPLSVEGYLESELLSPVKREFINGDIYAMAGASSNHNRIVTNLAGELRTGLKNTPCEVFVSDMKVQVKSDFFYPDVLVVCHHQANDQGVAESPLILVEVLSKSTRRIDHTLKRTAYQQLPSLMEYVVIEQDFVDVEVCRRSRHWQSEHFYLGDEIFFKAIELRLSVAEIYDRVDNKDMLAYLQSLQNQEQLSL